MSEGREVEVPDASAPPVRLYVDADGNPTDDPRQAVRGEIVEHDGRASSKRTWFLLDEVEIKWLPMSESAFLLWVFVALVAVWVGLAVLLRLF